jgi:hypothetical protein
MKKENQKGRGIQTKIVLLLAILALLLITGCSGDDRGRCSAGDACVYYQGSQGVITRLENAPTTLYFHSSDLGQIDSNAAEFNLRLENEGASYAYGAAFIEGFDPNIFRLYKMVDGQWQEIHINKNSGNCYFNLLGFGTDGLGFNAGCLGYGVTGYRQSNAVWGLGVDLQKIGVLFGEDWPAVTLRFDERGENNFNINAGFEGNTLNVLTHGAYLMALVSGLDFENYGGSVITMKGDNPDSPGGDIDYKEFKAEIYKPWPAGQDYIRLPYQIKTCYAYTTFISPMICIDPNPFSEEDKICTSQAYSWGGSQGAPVAVTRLEQTNTGSEVILDFTIRNVGPGTVWDIGQLEACSPYYPGKVKSSMHDVVYVGQGWIGDMPIDCSRQSSVRLDPNTKEARFTCSYDIRNAADIGGAYATPLKMELWYGYEEAIKRQLTIRRLG